MRSGAAWKPEGAHPSVNDVQRWWDQAACGTQFTEAEKFSEDYFEQIEKARYGLEPMILDFADFPGARDRDVLEVGVGAGTDFVNWVRHGARAHGVDLTLEAIEHTRRRLQMERLEPAALEQANAEALDFADASFDLVYSWGVIHHSPSSQRSLAEIVRVTRPGGTIKLMVYHRHSVAAFMVWLRRCALRGRPDRSLSYAMAHFVESPGTRAFTQQEVKDLLARLPVNDVRVRTVLTWCDVATKSRSRLYRGFCRSLAALGGGDRVGWFMLIEATKSV